MPKQQKPPLPNAFEQARNTGKIGGSGKRKDPNTDRTTQEPINTGLQETVKSETTETEKKEPTTQMQNTQVSTPQPTEEITNTGTQKTINIGKEEEMKKQTIDLPKSLARRVKNHATNRDEKIRDVHIRALEKLLAEEGG